MKISLICNKFKKSGGMEQYTLDLVLGFNKINIIPQIYSMYFDSKLQKDYLYSPVEISAKIIPNKLRFIFFSYVTSKLLAKHQGFSISTSYNKSDIIVCGGNHLGYLKTLNKNESLIDKLKIKNERQCFQTAKTIIAHSKMMKDEIVGLYKISPEKIKVLYPPVNMDKFSVPSLETKEKLKEKFGFNKNETIYLFPSTGHKRKGFEILKGYFDKTDLPIRLIVAGTPVKETKNIMSLGFCENMDELYKASDFTIMASNYEPFGLVGIESILSGTPIIFSENMACTEVLKEDFGYLFDRNNINSLDNAIKKSLEKKWIIEEPSKVLSYNPSIQNHITGILGILNNI